MVGNDEDGKYEAGGVVGPSRVEMDAEKTELSS